ncbi:F-box only protein 32 [Pitangus sulphuratus]|nr:F-box only protein 32 [Pitangus sulphuratus]
MANCSPCQDALEKCVETWSFCKKDDHNKENLFNSLNYDVAAKKRKKDLLNNKAKTQYFHQEKWIYVHKGSTKERHGYCTLGEAFNRLDFSSAILDSRRFNYVVRLLELIAKSQLTSLSGIAQKNYMNILEKVVQKVLEDQQNIRLIRELLQTLYTSLCTLVQRVGKSVLVGNINMWVHRMESILHWQQQLNNIQITRPPFKGTTFTDLPLCLQLNIMQRLSDGRDLVSLGQVAPDLQVLSEDRLLWKKLCQYHFTDRQIRKRLILSDKGQLDWKKMYFKLIRCYPRKEQYGDTLQLCRHCHILSWKVQLHLISVRTANSLTQAPAQKECFALRGDEILQACESKVSYEGSPTRPGAICSTR